MIIDGNTHGLYGKDLGPLEKAGGKWAKKNLADLKNVTRDKPHYFDMAFLKRTTKRSLKGISGEPFV